MGGRLDLTYHDEFPKHSVNISSFFMDKYEVTNTQFTQFVNETSYLTTAERDLDWSELQKQLPPGTPKPPGSVFRAGSLVFMKTAGRVNPQD